MFQWYWYFIGCFDGCCLGVGQLYIMGVCQCVQWLWDGGNDVEVGVSVDYYYCFVGV